MHHVNTHVRLVIKKINVIHVVMNLKKDMVHQVANVNMNIQNINNNVYFVKIHVRHVLVHWMGSVILVLKVIFYKVLDAYNVKIYVKLAKMIQYA